MARLWRGLRSRRVASYLLVYVTAFFGVATLVPWGGPESPEVMEWAAANPFAESVVRALGMHDPYTTPWFLVPALWLAASTCACAYERTVSALRVMRSQGSVKSGDLRSLEGADALHFRLPASGDADPLDRVAAVARSVGMRVRRGPVAIFGYSRSIGLLGSPVFHAAMGLLFVFATMGWLTRAEGGIALLRDRAKEDARASYLAGATTGLLFGDAYTGYELTVREVIENHIVDGVGRGSAARIEVRDDDRLVRSQLVYTNHPLRLGTTLIHHPKDRWGLAAVISVGDTGSVQAQTIEVPFERDPDAPLGHRPYLFTIEPSVGEAIDVSVTPDKAARLAILAGSRDRAIKSDAVIGEGESFVIPRGPRITVVELTRWAEVTVVRDWSVPFLYLMFILGTVGVTLTMYVPYRSLIARTARRADGDETVVSVVVRAQKNDPAFRLRVMEAFQNDGFERIG